jgi:hypothetical protein
MPGCLNQTNVWTVKFSVGRLFRYPWQQHQPFATSLARLLTKEMVSHFRVGENKLTIELTFGLALQPWYILSNLVVFFFAADIYFEKPEDCLLAIRKFKKKNNDLLPKLDANTHFVIQNIESISLCMLGRHRLWKVSGSFGWYRSESRSLGLTLKVNMPIFLFLNFVFLIFVGMGYFW